jgi:HME family heavy-metal exporter
MVFVVLYSRYQSPALALIIMGNIPLALIGSVIALNIAGQPLSVASMIGFITLAGISARNGILKVSHYINLALYEGERFGKDLVIRGSLERLTPVLMTALSAGLALIPLLIGADEPGARSCTRGGDDLRRADLGDADRHLPHPGPVPDLRQKAAGAHPGQPRGRAGGLTAAEAF